LLKHQKAIAEAKTTLFRDFVTGHTMTFYGNLSPELTGRCGRWVPRTRRSPFCRGWTRTSRLASKSRL